MEFRQVYQEDTSRGESLPSARPPLKRSAQLPFLFLSGAQDELVPPAHMESLHKECTSEVKLLKIFDDGTHNDTCVQQGYFELIAHFIKCVVPVARVRAA
jgi:fermentation-respiration switch protein FrsA (DUF1100 family)